MFRQDSNNWCFGCICLEASHSPMCPREWNEEELAKGLILVDVKIPFSSTTESHKNPNGVLFLLGGRK